MSNQLKTKAMTAAEKARLDQMPAGMKKVYRTGQIIIAHLRVNGTSQEDAENIVLELLKENKNDLIAGKYKKVELLLQYTFKEYFPKFNVKEFLTLQVL